MFLTQMMALMFFFHFLITNVSWIDSGEDRTHVCVMQVIQGLRAALVRTSQVERAEVTAGLC